MAWMIAVLPSRLATATSSGAPVKEGPTNIVTAGSDVSKCRQ